MGLQKTDVAAIGLIAAGAIAAHQITTYLVQPPPQEASIRIERSAPEAVVRLYVSPVPRVLPPVPRVVPPAPRAALHRSELPVYFAPWPPQALESQEAQRLIVELRHDLEEEMKRKRRKRRRPPRR